VTLILAVDDDPALLRTLALNLRARGYHTATAPDGHTAVALVHEHHPDLIVLDLGLPDLDGAAVLTHIRETSQVPIIVLSARHGSEDKVTALDLGADDYVTKPFGMEELFARIRTALRHTATSRAASRRVIRTATLELDLSHRLAHRNGQPVHLTPTEWRLVEVLTREPGQLVDRIDLLQEVWGPAYERENQLPARLPRPTPPQAGEPTQPTTTLHHRTRRRLPLPPMSRPQPASRSVEVTA
jgi:two-component system, OmpR family, KDP operon response regulator KdpE